MIHSPQITLGKIIGVFGVQGWVKVFSYTDPISNILNYSPWQIVQCGQSRTIRVCEGQMHGKSIIARLETCEDREMAIQFLGAEIAIYREQLPPIGKGEYYWADLMGLTVLNREGITLGQVDHLLKTGANDVLVVKGEKEHLIPFLLDQVVLEVDLVGGQLQVDWDAEF